MMLSAYASGTLSEPAIRTTAPTRSYPPANTGDQPWSETGARKRGSASSPPQNVAGAASEAISLGLGWVDDPLHREPVRADRLALDSLAKHRQCPLPTGRGSSVDFRSSAVTVPGSNSCVVVIDDDPDFRASLGRLLRSVGLNPQLFASIADYRGFEPPDCPTCLVLDVRLPGRSGLDFQRDLAAANTELPIVFITGHGDIPMTVQAMKGGAIEFLTKPFRDQDLLDAVNLGLARDRVRREQNEALSALRTRFEVLTLRERRIMIQVAQGRRNKQIAGDMGIAEATVKVHRSARRALPHCGQTQAGDGALAHPVTPQAAAQPA